MRVLLVEDDQPTASALARILKAADMVVDFADTGEEACDLVKFYDYDIILMDLMLPDMDGYEVVRRTRASRIDTPIVVLSGLCRPQAKVKALALGADDFITKPFDTDELMARIRAVVRRSKGFSHPMLRIGRLQLMARIRAVVRRSKGFSHPMLRIGRLQLNQDGRQVLVDGKEVHITSKEYAILELLVLRRGMVLTKEAFLNHLYGGMDEPEMKIIDVFICKLRKKLALAGAPDMIATVWGRGYMMRECADAQETAPALIAA